MMQGRSPIQILLRCFFSRTMFLYFIPKYQLIAVNNHHAYHYCCKSALCSWRQHLYCQQQDQWPSPALCFGRIWDKGSRWTNTARNRAWKLHSTLLIQGNGDPWAWFIFLPQKLLLLLMPKPGSQTALSTPCGCDSLFGILLWTKPKETSGSPRTLMLWSLIWYNSNCYLRHPREKQFTPHLKSKGSCEKRMMHTKAIPRG